MAWNFEKLEVDKSLGLQLTKDDAKRLKSAPEFTKTDPKAINLRLDVLVNTWKMDNFLDKSNKGLYDYLVRNLMDESKISDNILFRLKKCLSHHLQKCWVKIDEKEITLSDDNGKLTLNNTAKKPLYQFSLNEWWFNIKDLQTWKNLPKPKQDDSLLWEIISSAKSKVAPQSQIFAANELWIWDKDNAKINVWRVQIGWKNYFDGDKLPNGWEVIIRKK